MFPMGALAVATLGALVVSSTPSVALTGAACIYMNDYIRALGTVENGTGACGMSMEEAQRILAARDRETSGAAELPAPTKHPHRTHHRTKRTHPQ